MTPNYSGRRSPQLPSCDCLWMDSFLTRSQHVGSVSFKSSAWGQEWLDHLRGPLPPNYLQRQCPSTSEMRISDLYALADLALSKRPACWSRQSPGVNQRTNEIVPLHTRLPQPPPSLLRSCLRARSLNLSHRCSGVVVRLLRVLLVCPCMVCICANMQPACSICSGCTLVSSPTTPRLAAC